MAEKKKQKYYQRSDGIFESIRTINGKRVAFRGKSCKEVDRKILENQDQQERGRPFPEIADEWEIDHEAEISESTRRAYSFAVRRLKTTFPGLTSELRPLDIKRYINAFEAEGRAMNSVQIELAVCKMICNYAVMAGDIDVSPAEAVHKSRGLPAKKRLALTEEQENVVLTAESGRKGSVSFGFFLMFTGLRRGEALALSYKDIDRKDGVIHITKNFPML